MPPRVKNLWSCVCTDPQVLAEGPSEQCIADFVFRGGLLKNHVYRAHSAYPMVIGSKELVSSPVMKLMITVMVMRR
ncbi:hypothetical protein D3C85_1150400 [compost metagenome]